MKHKTINLNKKLCQERLGELETTDSTDVPKEYLLEYIDFNDKKGMKLSW